MFRSRLSVRTGCVRRKKRRKKCDERKPACGYCACWNLECSFSEVCPPSLWPGQTSSQRATRSAPLENALSVVRVGVTALDPFHELPVPDAEHRLDTTGYLHHFFSNMISGALPFDIQSTRLELSRGWARSAFDDIAVSYAFAAYSARLQSQSSAGMLQEQHALEFEKHALAALRWRVYYEPRPTEQTILLASLHSVMLAFDQPDVQELCRVFSGIAAMMVAYGGYARGLRNMRPSTVQSIEICDMFCAFLNGTRPFYQPPKAPLRPQSLNNLHVGSWYHSELEHRCESDVLDVVREMNIILFFRHPSRQTRDLLSHESLYLHQLLCHSENKLAILQVRYKGAGTLSEVMVHGMIVLKRDVIPDSSQHVSLSTAIIQRLYTVTLASSATAVHDDKLHQDVLIWVCVVALFRSKKGDMRAGFLAIMVRMVRLRYEGTSPWPHDWQRDIRKGLISILWHARLEERFFPICDILQDDERVHPWT